MGFENLGRTRMPPKTRHPVKTCWHCRKKASNLSRSVFEAFSINWVSRFEGFDERIWDYWRMLWRRTGMGLDLVFGRQAGREHSDSMPQID